MATFTTEEVELLKNRGNDYCKNVWLGLYEGSWIPVAESRDEQTVKDFMIDKYERKRYYLDPAQALKNGYTKTSSPDPSKIKPLNTLISDPKPIKLNGNTTINAEFNRKRPEAIKNSGFAVNFDRADIFSSNNNSTTTAAGTTAGFANFDDNPVFDNSTKTNGTGMPTPAAFDSFNLAQTNKLPVAPPQDKYAALKDLDNALKTQNHSAVDWNSSGSNGSLYSSPTPTGSMYSSPSPQSSMFGSPSQGHFMSSFQNHQDNAFSNPFNNTNSIPWGSNGTNFGNGQAFANPFRTNGFTPAVFPVATNGAGWGGANPFKVGATANMNSNNPFL